MIQVDRRLVRAPLAAMFALAADVERWPERLGHYRWVRFLERRPEGGVVEMAAWRPVGPLRYPTWWVSEMTIDRAAPAVLYRHVRGVTRGMDVRWDFTPRGGSVEVILTHWWDGPAWPFLGAAAASLVIGPLFIHHIAQRTLAGLAGAAEGSSV
jgi:ribosome-associated toxin RatA of RatAB toxin-antitoxin module